MKEWLEYLKDEILLWWDYYFGHQHKYTMIGMCLYKGEPREHPCGVPLVAWIYRCRCGNEIVELNPSGIRLLQQGVDYDALIECRI